MKWQGYPTGTRTKKGRARSMLYRIRLSPISPIPTVVTFISDPPFSMMDFGKPIVAHSEAF
jgi:hypothetical protein